MAEPYSDEALAAISADPNHTHDLMRLWPTIWLLQAQRDAAIAELSTAVRLAETQQEALRTTLGHLHEARRVAGVLARACSHSDAEVQQASATALAYPEVQRA